MRFLCRIGWHDWKQWEFYGKGQYIDTKRLFIYIIRECIKCRYCQIKKVEDRG